MKKLITFGDSWVWGIGAGYEKGQSRDEYMKLFQNKSYTDKSFRRLLAHEYGLENKNFSSGGSSNQRQFRIASEFFIKNKDRLSDDMVVLWGLTSVYRTELFDVKSEEFISIFMPDNIPGIELFSKIYTTKYFDEVVETYRLYYQIELFNSLFKGLGIKNYWFNVFNEHQFPKVPDNMLFGGRSLLSLLIDTDLKDSSYHKSDWDDVDWKITKAKDTGLVNPHSGHPTQAGHLKIFEYLRDELGEDLG
tara:strand:- start:54 stop:797 length:744 start_codon:yes stop_codon:yes gene_type:complete